MPRLRPVRSIVRQVGQPRLEEGHVALGGLNHHIITVHDHHKLQASLRRRHTQVLPARCRCRPVVVVVPTLGRHLAYGALGGRGVTTRRQTGTHP